MSTRVKGLYAVTPDGVPPALLMELVDAAIAGGAALVQYRDKSASADQLTRRAKALMALCRARRIPLIVNDHLELAEQIDADGVHLGDGDGGVAAARERLGRLSIIGVSCYQSLERAKTASALGASYVAFGSVFASSVKPHAKSAPLPLFRQARQAGIEIPLVGIGGITPQNLASLIEAGASAAAVISGVFGSLQHDAVFANARRLSNLFAS
jgi:thiamine-phosphate pyrophosphorylase